MSNRPVAVDLFCGGGGLSLGLEGAGMDLKLHIDNEPHNVGTMRDMFGYGDSVLADLADDQSKRILKTLREEPFMLGAGFRPDIMAGGPPCQGLSIMGKKDERDPRNDLSVSYAETICRVGPRYAVLENVPMLIHPNNRRLLDRILETLSRGGYEVVEPKVLNAVEFGVPQKRERVVLLIYRRGEAAPAYPQPTHGPGAADFFARPTPTVADAFDGLPDAADYPALWETDTVHADFPAPATRYSRMMRGVENDPDDLSYPRIWDRDLLTCSKLTRHEPESVERFMATKPGGSERTSRRHRLDPNGQSLTLRAGTGAEKGSFTAVVPIVPNGTRSITCREAARLHSFPDWMRLGGPDRSKIRGFRQVGNSVPPLLARAIGHEIMKAAGIKVEAPTDTIDVREEKLQAAA